MGDPKATNSQDTLPMPTTTSEKHYPWYTLAQSYIGKKEIPGSKTDTDIAKWLKDVGQKGDDEIPWCAAFVGAMLKQTGYKSTGSARARSYLDYGTKVTQPYEGCIVVFWRESPMSGKGHVAFFVRYVEGGVLVLGGNQNDQVCEKIYPMKNILGFRAPVAVEKSVGNVPEPAVPPVGESVAVVTCPTTPEEYLAKFNVAKILESKRSIVLSRAKTLARFKDTFYLPVAREVVCPWWVPALIHNQERGSDVGAFKAVLHNGEKIIGTGKKTKFVPAGKGPFATWQEAAIDALGGPGGLGKRKWDYGSALEFFERYNGLGYRRRGVASPYDWAMTDQYTKGHFGEAIGADGKPHSTFYPDKVSKNYGCAAILKGLIEIGEI